MAELILDFLKVKWTVTLTTRLNAAATITLVSKIGVATIQSQPPLDMGKRFSQSIVGTPQCGD